MKRKLLGLRIDNRKTNVGGQLQRNNNKDLPDTSLSSVLSSAERSRCKSKMSILITDSNLLYILRQAK